MEQYLLAWKAMPGRMPLLVTGARQVGKSYTIRAFGQQHYRSLLLVNFEMEEAYQSFFQGSLQPKDIIRRMESYFGIRIEPEETLIFFDEIQLCERALTALKYFLEEAPEYHVIGAGSLLGISLSRQSSAFPVGKVMRQPMFPMDFQEFLWATDNSYLDEQITWSYHEMKALHGSLHMKGLDLYRQYLITGGMPAAVSTHVAEHPAVPEQDIKQFILDAYVADIAKFVDNVQAVRVRACYDSIPQQLAKENKKFQWKLAMRGGRAALLGDAVDWLVQAGTVLKCDLTAQGEVPPKAYVDPASFKLYMNDVGLLSRQVRLTGASLEENSRWFGVLAENYVAQTLAAQGFDLMYWTSTSTAEVDFVLMQDGLVVPVEVKAGGRVLSRSLDVFMERYASKLAYRISARNFGRSGPIRSVPLYAAHCIGK